MTESNDSRSAPPVGSLRRFAVELAIVAAVTAGVIEASIRLFALRPGPHRPVYGDERLLWMVPLGYLAAILPFVVLALAIARRGSERPRFPAVVVVILWPALFALLAIIGKLYLASLAVIALGLAFAFARLLARGGLGVEQTIRRVAPMALALVPLLAGGLRLRSAWIERRWIAGLPTAPDSAPNVLLLVWDTVRAKNLSLYGYPRPTTPNLERLADSGVSYRHAFTTAPWTLPAHATMVSGLLEQEMVVGHMTPFATDRPLLSEALTRRGYLTGGFVGNTTYAGKEYGLSRGFLQFEDYRRTVGTVLLSPVAARRLDLEWRLRRVMGITKPFNKKTATDVNREFLRWVDRAEGRPFFALLNYFDAHNPYVAPPPFDTAFGADPKRRLPPRAVRKAAVDRIIAGYDATIAYLDHETGRLIDSLRHRQLLDNTVVIVTADHGEHFGEDGLYNHSNSLYQELLHVPLVIRFPRRVPEARSVATPVSLRDLAATISDLVGLGDHPFPGSSLLAEGGPADDSAGYRIIAGETTLPGQFSNAIITNGFYFIDWPGRPPALYRFPADTAQATNLASRPEFAPAMAAFKASSDSLNRVRTQIRSGR